MLQPGESLDGYRVIRLIGSGGFGAVWLCQSEALGDFRALKFIPAIDPGRIEKEFDALCRYRTAAGRLRSPSVMPIEHVNRRIDGLFYIMPLADGFGAADPLDPAWRPLTMASIIDRRREEPTWFTSEEIKGYITPILQALQLLSDAGLVHRDVKPDNILFLNGSPCLGDISLLGEDSHNITRRGTPGYSAPSWFVESGGHPDMFGAATTLYSLLTGNPPDKMGRTAFRWPPQGESSLSAPEKQEWQRIHRIIRRTVDERPAERFQDFSTFAQALETGAGVEGQKPGASKLGLYFAATAAVILLVAGWLFLGHWQGTTPKPAATPAAVAADSGKIPEAYREELQRLDDTLKDARKELAANRALISVPVDTAVAALKQLSQKPSTPLKEVASRLLEIQKALEKALEKVPPIPQGPAIVKIEAPLKAIAEKIHSIPQTTEEKVNYGWEVEPMVNLKIQKFDEELNGEQEFRAELMQKAGTPLYRIEEKFGRQLAPDQSGLDPNSEAIMEMTTAINLRLIDLTKL